MQRRLWTKIVAVGAVAAGALALMPAAVEATPARPAALVSPICVVVSVGLPLGSCNTGAVGAGAGAAVWININTGIVAPCQYVVRDVANDWPVRTGSSTGHFATRIGGLYSHYRLELNWCTNGSTGLISPI
jgi:hypothetical protein